MEKKFSLILDKEFIDYCTLNKIEDVEKYAKDVFTKGFNLVKYGSSPFTTFITTPLPRPITTKESLPKEKIDEVIEKTKEKVKNSNLYDE